jgi:hypothetical protein
LTSSSCTSFRCCSPLRQPRGRRDQAREGPGGRGARRHPHQVQGGAWLAPPDPRKVPYMLCVTFRTHRWDPFAFRNDPESA